MITLADTPRSRRRRLRPLLAVAGLAAALAGTPVPGAQAATPTAAAASDQGRAVVAPAGGFTRDSFTLVGDWTIDYTFDRRLGVPASDTTPSTYLLRFRTWPTASFLGNDPVYVTDEYEFAVDGAGHRCVRLVAGAFLASPFVGPRGINVTANFAGNPDTGRFADAYAGTLALRSANVAGTPVEFSGVWNDIDANGGQATLTPVVAPPACGSSRWAGGASAGPSTG